MGATKEEVAVLGVGDGLTDLPPGFRFHPTDEEIITHYLSVKTVNKSFSSRAIGDVDLNRNEPWDLPSKAKMGEKEWYFFCQRDRKYPTGIRTNRATDSGYWKATGKDKEIYKGKNCLVGMKKTLVFYLGRAPKGEKTNWVMHEYRLEGKSLYHNPSKSSKDEWVVCRVFHKITGLKKASLPELLRMDSFGMNLSFVDACLDSPSLPTLLEAPSSRPSSTFADDGDGGDVKGIAATLTNPSHLAAFSTGNPQGPQNSFYLNTTYSTHSSQVNNPSAQAHQGSVFYPLSAPMTPHHSRPTSADGSYLHQQYWYPGLLSHQTATASGSHSRVEPYSNQSLVSASQDTAPSTDRNTEISSVVSRHDVGYRSYDDDLDCPSCSAGPAADLEDLWEF